MPHKNSEFKKATGSRAEVIHGTAKHTSGGLRIEHLMYNKSGRIVSKAKSIAAKAAYPKIKHKLAKPYTKKTA